MLVTATFTCELLPPYGVPIRSLKMQLDPFEVKEGGTRVRVIPVIDEMSYEEPIADGSGNEIGERQVRYHTLHSIKVVVERDVASVAPKVFDRTLFESPAMSAIRDTLRQIRAITGISLIDVHAATVDATYSDENGQSLPWWSTNSISLDGIGAITDGDWREVASNVIHSADTSLTFELEMEASRFLRQRNYAMPVLNAAIACEIHLNRLATPALTNNLGITEREAKQMTRELKLASLMALVDRHYDLPANEFLPSFGEVPTKILIKNTTDARNQIAHGDKEVQPSEDQARRALEAATRLSNARLKASTQPAGAAN